MGYIQHLEERISGLEKELNETRYPSAQHITHAMKVILASRSQSEAILQTLLHLRSYSAILFPDKCVERTELFSPNSYNRSITPTLWYHHG